MSALPVESGDDRVVAHRESGTDGGFGRHRPVADGGQGGSVGRPRAVVNRPLTPLHGCAVDAVGTQGRRHRVEHAIGRGIDDGAPPADRRGERRAQQDPHVVGGGDGAQDAVHASYFRVTQPRHDVAGDVLETDAAGAGWQVGGGVDRHVDRCVGQRFAQGPDLGVVGDVAALDDDLGSVAPQSLSLIHI